MQSNQIVVVGAGMVGACCALYLQRKGHNVKLVDSHDPGSLTSSGNAATFANYACIPINNSNIYRTFPSLLFGDSQPLSISPTYLLFMMPWLVKFLRNCRSNRVAEIISALGNLLEHSEEASMLLFREANLTSLLKHAGSLYLYENKKSLDSARDEINCRRDLGIKATNLDLHSIRDLEPNLAPIFAGGVLFDDAFHLINPEKIVKGLVSKFVSNGGEFEKNYVSLISRSENEEVAVTTESKTIVAKNIVIAAGAWSMKISSPIMDRLPLETERGYHVMFPNDSKLINRPIGLAEAGIYLTPLDEGLRAAGTVELAGLHAKPNIKRINYIEKHVRQSVSHIGQSKGNWLGFRPTLPDSLPIIGRAIRCPSIIYAFGHQHIGMTLGGITGKLVQQIVDGEKTTVDVFPYRADRF